MVVFIFLSFDIYDLFIWLCVADMLQLSTRASGPGGCEKRGEEEFG